MPATKVHVSEKGVSHCFFSKHHYASLDLQTETKYSGPGKGDWFFGTLSEEKARQ